MGWQQTGCTFHNCRIQEITTRFMRRTVYNYLIDNPEWSFDIFINDIILNEVFY